MTHTARPAPFSAYTTPEFWDDPHISQQLLRHHLDPTSPLASRTHAFIDRSVEWLVPALALRAGSRLLDLGCGPGLYATRLARRGIEVLGIDVSRRSLAHAREIALQESLPITLRRGSYLQADLGSGHDAAILIFEDYSALSPTQRTLLLRRVRDALVPGGRVLFDVTAAARFATVTEDRREAPNLMDGFWAATPYLGTHETWTYPDLRLVLDRYTIRSNASTREFWNWMHCLTTDEVTSEVTSAGFVPPTFHGDVAGAPYRENLDSFAAISHRL